MLSPADPPDDDSERVWEVRVGLYCTERQARDVVDQIQLLLCPDPDHAPPCPVPWSTAHWSLDDEEAATSYPDLVDQARTERRPQ